MNLHALVWVQIVVPPSGVSVTTTIDKNLDQFKLAWSFPPSPSWDPQGGKLVVEAGRQGRQVEVRGSKDKEYLHVYTTF